MKYVLLLVAAALIYFVARKNAPAPPVARTITAQDAAPLTAGPRQPAAPPATAPATTALKRPLDRTRSTLDAVKQRNGNGEF